MNIRFPFVAEPLLVMTKLMILSGELLQFFLFVAFWNCKIRLL
jgi:hypothetical protein